MNEDSLKKAFSKVKEDILSINARLDLIESKINELLAQATRVNPMNPINSNEFQGFKPSKPQINEFSSGNKGVQSINHSTNNQSFNNQSLNQSRFEQYTPQISENYEEKPKINQSPINHQSITNQSVNQTNIHSLSIQSLKKELESRFNALTNQEFLVFLTIYQLEEDLGRPVTYADLSSKLNLTSGCIRGYVSALIRKKLPIIKSKINNRTLTLAINPEFRDLGLKEKLTNLYYNQDPEQTRLF